MKNRHQIHLYLSLNDLVPEDHEYRKLDCLLDIAKLSQKFPNLYSCKGRKEKGTEFGLRCLILQFMNDLSDREMERFLKENNAGKWYCDLELNDKAPDHSYFGDFRKRLGTKRLMDCFSYIRDSLKEMNLIRNVFTFVDSSQLITKLTTWEERDKAIKLGLEKFNNDVAEKKKIAADTDARFGCKGKKKYWFGYKEHTAVDMQSGLISKVAATSAEVTDADGLKHVCPNTGAVFGDKGYCIKPAQTTLKRKGCHNATIKKDNMKGKDRAKDKWISAMRSPYERVFAHRNKRTRYRGIEKVQFQVGIRALVFNLTRLMNLGVEKINLAPL